MKHIIRPVAKDDIMRQFRYYLVDRDRPEVANGFLKAVERTVANILRTPKGGAPKHLSNNTLINLRSWPVQGFEDVRIYYLVQAGEVQVVRILHGKRDIQRILEQEA